MIAGVRRNRMLGFVVRFVIGFFVLCRAVQSFSFRRQWHRAADRLFSRWVPSGYPWRARLNLSEKKMEMLRCLPAVPAEFGFSIGPVQVTFFTSSGSLPYSVSLAAENALAYDGNDDNSTRRSFKGVWRIELDQD